MNQDCYYVPLNIAITFYYCLSCFSIFGILGALLLPSILPEFMENMRDGLNFMRIPSIILYIAILVWINVQYHFSAPATQELINQCKHIF